MNKNLAYYIREYFTTYLSMRRNCSKNTITSYKDTIKLFLLYNQEIKSEKIANININVWTYENINQFLDYLQEKRNISNNSRNQRLTMLKSFSKYLLSYEPQMLEEIQKILYIHRKNSITKKIEILTKDEITELLQKPDIKTKQGKRELVILTLLYDAALRVDELIHLKVEDIIFDEIGKVIVKKGKGNKLRVVPIINEAKIILQEYINYFKLESNDYLITNTHKKIYTSNGIRFIINKYTKNFRFKVTPHTFRHTKACHLIDSGVPLIYIRDFLGHESVETTEIYAKISSEQKANNIIENSIPIKASITYNLDEDNDLLEWLSNL